MTVASNIGSPDHDVLSLAATNLDASPRVHGRVAPAAQLRTVARLEAVGTASDTLAQQSSLGEWGEKLGLSEPVQRDMFQRAMSKIFGSQAPPAPASNLRIGRHTILQTLGEGGMGVVYAAYDPELDRKVAIKLVNGDGAGVEGKARLLREAQAMAKLAHPNVAAIYDVGLCGEQVYVAMEFIKGETLKAWSERHRGDWRRLVAMFVDAGEGLEAAHCAGLVHRDFKPENVLVGDDGRPRVLDFGLVRAASHELETLDEEEDLSSTGSSTIMEALRDSSDALDGGLTRAGAIMGTPAYMSPEQVEGHTEAVDARSDQFSFCVALYEALYDQLPFQGGTLSELFAAIRRGVVRPPPRGSRVPAWIHRALLRGLAVDPAQRWPSMQELLDTLLKDPRRRVRLGAAVFGAAVLLSSASYGAAVTSSSAAEVCEAARDSAVEVWSEARRGRVRDALLASPATFAKDAWRRVDERVAHYAEGLSERRFSACEANRDGRQSDELFDLRSVCLDRRQAELEATLDVLEQAGDDVVERSVDLVASLSPLDACDDAKGLRAAIPPPADPATAAAVEGLRSELGRAEIFKRAGKLQEGLELARRIRIDAEELHYTPLIARALVTQGDLEMEYGAHEDAARDLHRAIWLAVEVGDAEVTAEAASKWLYVAGTRLTRGAEVEVFEPFVLAAARHLDEGNSLRPLAYSNVGAVHYRRGDLEGAERNFVAALDIWESLRAPNRLEFAGTLNNLGVTLNDRGHHDEAARHLERALAMIEREVGSQHPSLAYPLFGLAAAQLELGELTGARDRYSRSLTLIEENMGSDVFMAAYPTAGLGRVAFRQGEIEPSLAWFERSLALWQASGAEDRDHGDVLCSYAEALRAAERDEEAEAATATAADIFTAHPLPEGPTGCAE